MALRTLWCRMGDILRRWFRVSTTIRRNRTLLEVELPSLGELIPPERPVVVICPGANPVAPALEFENSRSQTSQPHAITDTVDFPDKGIRAVGAFVYEDGEELGDLTHGPPFKMVRRRRCRRARRRVI